NQGTSATSTAQVVANSAWTTTDVTAMPDALQGDGMSLLGNLSASAPLDLDQSPGTSVAGNPALAYNSDWVNNHPIITPQVPSDPPPGMPGKVSAQLSLNGGSPQTSQSFSTTGFHQGDLLTIGQQVASAVTTTGRYTYSLQITMNYGTPIVRTINGAIFVVAQ